MTSVSPSGSVRVSLLVDEDGAALARLLEQDARGTVYLRSLVHEFGIQPTEALSHGRFFGFWRRGSLVAVAFVGNARNMSTLGEPGDVEALLERVRRSGHHPRLFVGPEEHAPAVRRQLFRDGADPRLDREQSYYVLERDQLPEIEPLPVRLAVPGDLDQVVDAHTHMISEDLLIPPRHLDQDRLRVLTRDRIAEKRIWVHMAEGTLLFKTEEVGRSGEAVMVGGVFTAHAYRGRGVATRGMIGWAKEILRGDLQRLALHVNTANTPAVRAYQRSGYRLHSRLRLILTY